MDWLIYLAIAIPFVALGTAIVRDFRGLRSSHYQPQLGPPSEAAEQRYGGVFRLVGWIFIAVSLYPFAAETVRLAGWGFVPLSLRLLVAEIVRLFL
ncbi:hypothetical protein [Streptomyces sp. NPDC102360]|uniref:hypothetical protein n=1 Tax=Streptomyces sp. NPDC102360 TaxID=3366160 RepID=UPI0037FCD614